jgi:hypothetical protein
MSGYVPIRASGWGVVADQGASMSDPSSFDLVATFMKIVFVVVGLLFVFAIIRGIIYAPRRRKILRDAGLNPMTASAQMEANPRRVTLRRE